MRTQGPDAARAAALRGQIAVANSKLVYQRFKEIFESERFKALGGQGRPRPASALGEHEHQEPGLIATSCMWETLVGPDTVNTLPDETIVAFRDHGKARVTVEEGVEEARAAFRTLAELELIARAVGEELSERVWTSSPNRSTSSLPSSLPKRQALEADMPNRYSVSLGHTLQDHVDQTLTALERDGMARRLWSKDPSLWKAEPERQALIAERLGWLTIAEAMTERAGELAAFADEIKQGWVSSTSCCWGWAAARFAPEVYRQVFGVAPDAPDLIGAGISTDPAAIRSVGRKIGPGPDAFPGVEASPARPPRHEC